MKSYSRPATWDDLVALVRQLDAEAARYIVIGGYAMAAHGFMRFTEDIDLLVDSSVDNSRRWIEALARLPDGAAAGLRAEPDVFGAQGHYAIRINDEFAVDVMSRAGGRSWQDLQSKVTLRNIDGVNVPVLNLEGLLLTKQGAQPKDQMDASFIAAAMEALAT
ncbi:MAG: nucleotidyl transferase AbiEii/AbiGii toxin family protein [Rhodocyclaceae bacterium]|nr:nucleotidyl transferase AbiEii/AbiGii toxin family protein [Rhodocyclaceae bacterium]MBX3667994.1 nucleotidyl transferase AbiEii/AbiGii toxin family protein [Rhodocyclaceae bacterium]